MEYTEYPNISSVEEDGAPGFSWGPIHVVLMGIILGLALLGNTSICWIVVTDPKLRSGPNKLVLNLAVCGLFTVVANGPLVLLVFAEEDSEEAGWRYGRAACQFNGFTTSVYGLASVLTLAVISVNRYQLIRRSTGRFASWFTRSTIRSLIAGVWIFSVLLAFPPVVGWSQYEYIPERAICTLKWSTEISYTVFVFTFGIFLPFIVMFVAYFAIFKLVRNKFKRMRLRRARGNPNASFSRKMSNSSLGRFLANATERWESQQQVSEQGEGDAACKASVAAGAADSNPPRPVARNPLKPIVVSEAADENRAVLMTEPRTDPTTEPKAEPKANPKADPTKKLPRHRLGVQRDPTCCRSRSLVEANFKNDSRYIQVLNSPSGGVAERKNRSLTLAVPISYPADLPLAAGRSQAHRQPRPRSAHSRICRTSSAPEQVDPTLKWKRTNCKSSRSGKSSNKLSIAGVNFLPPKDDLRVTVMVLTVLTSFVLCWSPVTIINFVESAWEVDVPLALNVFSVYMIFASSAINPLIYGMLNRNFRSGFRRFFCSFWPHCRDASKWCSCLPAKKVPRQNRISVINMNDNTIP